MCAEFGDTVWLRKSLSKTLPSSRLLIEYHLIHSDIIVKITLVAYVLSINHFLIALNTCWLKT